MIVAERSIKSDGYGFEVGSFVALMPFGACGKKCEVEDQEHVGFGSRGLVLCGKKPEIQLCVQADAGPGSSHHLAALPARLNTALGFNGRGKEERTVVYDIAFLHEIADGFWPQRTKTIGTSLHIELLPGAVLCFENLVPPEDSLIGFEDTPWHVHGDFLFASRRGQYLEMSHIDALEGLADGTILVCERWLDGALRDRWLAHRDYLDDFRNMERLEEIRVRRVMVMEVPSISGVEA